jgi:hypothetical protein
LESGVAGDIDLLAGTMLAGKNALITSGFYVLSTGITIATSLKIRVADSTLIHFLASESGSIFHVPTDRPDEQLNTTNPRVLGGFTPGTTNYVGLDFVRLADDTTVDLVEFIDSSSDLETPVQVPLARTLDYRIVIGTLDFENNPGVAPIAKVIVDDVGNINGLIDARQIAFRLGSGGTVPNILNSYSWPAGRHENTVGDTFVGGDKAIASFKEWMDATMTRMWELGGGEYWYSPTNPINERLARTGSPFVSNGEYFEWDGTNLHWKGLIWMFANSTGVFNAVANQTTDQVGLTDLVDGDCIYVDVDRTANRSGGSSLVAAKGQLATLGTPLIPGSRFVIAWNHGGSIYTRDQSYAVNSAFKLATTSAAGMVELNAADSLAATPPKVATIDTYAGVVMGEGLSRGRSGFGLGGGSLNIGGGDNDTGDVNIYATGTSQVSVLGNNNFSVTQTSALMVFQEDDFTTDIQNLTVRLVGWNVGTLNREDAHQFEAGGAMGWRNTLFPPQTPSPSGTMPIRSKFFMRDNGLSTPNTRDQFCIMSWDGSVTVIWESATY